NRFDSTRILQNSGFSLFDMLFDNTGNKLFLLDISSTELYEYSLTTPYDLSTAQSTSRSVDVGSTYIAAEFNDLGDTLNAMRISGSLRVFSLGNNYTLNNEIGTIISGGPIVGSSIRDFEYSSDGSLVFINNVVGTENFINEYVLSIPYDLSSATYSGNNERLKIQSGDINAFQFVAGGSILYTANASGVINKYLMNSPYDVSTGVLAETIQVGTAGSILTSILFNPDGTEVNLGYQNGNIIRFKLFDDSVPVLESSELTSSSEITLEFDTPIKFTSGNESDFELIDGLGNALAISGATVSNDTLLILSVDLTSATGDVELNYMNNSEAITNSNCNALDSFTAPISFDNDMQAPALLSVENQSGRIVLTYDEPVQLNVKKSPAPFVKFEPVTLAALS
ncbi:MAG: hypothetical protein AAFY41_15395, partial [Bacteroidota bacterium]